MYFVCGAQLEVLHSLRAGSKHHFDFDRSLRRHLGQMWLRGLVRPAGGDTWKITELGLGASRCGHVYH